jgi:Zn-dependent protease
VIDGLDRFAEPLLHALVAAVLLVLAVSVHESGHAWAALKRGDPTAAERGRLSWLPFSHFDLVGCLLLPLILVLAHAGFIMGYGRPTPVDPGRLKRPKADFSLVSLAGPAANLALALGLSLLGALGFQGLKLDSPEAALLLGAAIAINVTLACVNLLPLPGFDGLKALYAFLPDEWCWRLQRGEGLFLGVLLLAVLFGAMDLALYPSFWLGRALCTLAGVPLPAL